MKLSTNIWSLPTVKVKWPKKSQMEEMFGGWRVVFGACNVPGLFL
jgi:hypothetical protein